MPLFRVTTPAARRYFCDAGGPARTAGLRCSCSGHGLPSRRDIVQHNDVTAIGVVAGLPSDNTIDQFDAGLNMLGQESDARNDRREAVISLCCVVHGYSPSAQPM